MKIRTKLFIFISTLVALSILVTTWITSSALFEHIKDEQIDSVGKVAANRHQVLVKRLLNYKQYNQFFLNQLIAFCDSKISKNKLDKDCVMDRMKFFLKQKKANGAIFRQNNIDLIVGKITNQKINKNDFAEKQLAVFRNRGSENQAWPFYIMDENQVLGVEFFIEYPLDMIQEIFRPLDDLGKSGETFLADKEGLFVTEQRYYSKHGTHYGTEKSISANPMIRCLQKNDEAMLDLDYREEHIIHGFQYVPEVGGGCIMAHIEQAEAFLPLNIMKRKIIITAVILLIISLVLIFFFARNMMIPLVYLTDFVEAYGNGNSDAQIELQRKDEIGMLANKFNQLILSLKKSREMIELQQQTIFESSKLNAMADMARGVAHEINTPLTTIVLGAELIEHKNIKLSDPSKDISRLSQSIIVASGRIETIIKGLKGFSRDATQDEQNLFTVRQLIDTTLNLCGEMLKLDNINLIIQQDYLDTEIHGKETLLSQCLLNLIINSFEAVSKLNEKWIKIEVMLIDPAIEIRITDSGLGISDEIRKQMFRPMYTTKPIGSGPGLGLSVSRSIITNFGGSIIYDEKSDHTCFIMKWIYS